MADVIAKLKVDSGQFDQKLKSAVEQMTKMEQEVRRTGATFAYADKEELEFVRSLGSLESSSTSAKTKMMEYTNAIASLTATYRAMTDEEKKSDFGKGLSASIDELKVKAAKFKDIMSDTNIELKNLASDTSFTDGLGLMTRTVGSCAAAITAWSGKGKEMDEIVKELAKIGATVAAVDSLTKAFQKQNLVLLKNPYVAAAAGAVALAVAIGKVIAKSQELSAVDKALQDVQQKGRDNSAKEVARIETLNNILHDNTRSLDERRSALAQIQSLVPDYHGALTEEGTLINDNTDALQGYIDGLQRAALAQAAFDKMVDIQKQKLEKQVKLEDAQKELERQQVSASTPVTREEMMAQAGSGRNAFGAVESTKQTLVDAAQKQVDNLNAEIKEFNDQLDALQKLVKPSDLESPTTTTGKGGKTKGGGTITTANDPVAGSIAAQEAKVSELTKKWKEAADDPSRKIIKAELDEANRVLAEMTGKVESSSITTAADMWKDYTDKLKDVKDRLAEFQAMIKDQSLTDAQREWAQGMADAYQEQLNKMTNATEEAVEGISKQLQKIPTSFEMFKDGVGAIGSLVSAMDSLKNIGDDLAAVFNGEMDAWDSLMTVLQSGVGIMQTVIGVMEAINTLQEMSSVLSKKKIADQAAETTAVVTGKSAESTANLTEAGTSLTAAGASAAESSAAAGKAVAGIPIVGPILAVAAIAAVLGAAIAAIAKSKSAGSFAGGGMIMGNSYSGDNLTANVNSGELILNRAQQGVIANDLKGQQQEIRVVGMIAGSDLYLVNANYAKEQGLLGYAVGATGAFVTIK